MGNTTVSRRAFLSGTAGSVLAAGTAAAQENNSSGGGSNNGSAGGNASAGADQGGGGNGSAGNESAGNASGSGGGGETVTVDVGPNGEYVFKPGTNQPLTIAPGTTVKWVWKSDLHNIVVGSQPESANWNGTDGPPSKTYDTGHTYTHTFDTTGDYHYWCEPHKSLGMVADITVEQGAGGSGNGSGGGGGGDGGGPTVPDGAKSLGVASGFAMIVTLGLSFFFLKYGGEYETPEE